jgi:hypothetical protein
VLVAATCSADVRADADIDALPDWQQAICREVRDLVHAADHEVAETIKRTNRPYFVLQGNICALLAAKDHVNCFSTTAPSSVIRRESSPAATRTRARATTSFGGLNFALQLAPASRTLSIRQGEHINAPARRGA